MEANYKLATTRAYDFLLSNEFEQKKDYNMHSMLSDFPLNLKEYAKQEHNLVSYSSLAKELGISHFELKELLKNSWGTVVYKNHVYTIAYDDKLDESVQLFTIAHEIGHIELGHLIKPMYKDAIIRIKIGSIISPDSDLYKIMDNEADCFARNLLCPARLLTQAKYNFGPFDLHHLFGLSLSAASTRLDFLKSDLYYSKDVNQSDLVEKFYKFLSVLSAILECEMSDLYIQQKKCNYLFAVDNVN